MSMNILNTDVLVLGSGLAGLRAAWAALATDPELKVTVVSQRFGPSGSSFANINNKLGMQVCLDSRERENFINEAISIAPPGNIDPALVRIMAEESAARFREIEAIGFPFDRDHRGQLVRTCGCFSPAERRAFIFSGLATAFERLKDKFLSLGGDFLERWLVQDLVRESPGYSCRICGAVLERADGNEKMAINASSVIVALGGPAPLFIRNVGGPGTHGIAHALLERAGAELVNARYLQFLWHQVPSLQFWPIQECLTKGAMVRSLEGGEVPVPESLFELAGKRASHCPAGYDLDDTAVDRFFIEHLDEEGVVDVYTGQTGWATIALMAHAGNGGARIDENAWTGVPGLYACGESAGGMHGANRIGGAMVTGTQVFGARAGTAAAIYAAKSVAVDEKTFSRLAERTTRSQTEDEIQRQEIIPWLRRGMQAHALLDGRPGFDRFIRACRQRLSSVRDWRSKLALEAAVLIGRHML
jgi:L-aspartate oxidase